MQKLKKLVTTFQTMLRSRDAVDMANDLEDDPDKLEYKTIEKITPREVEEKHPVSIELKFRDDIRQTNMDI